MVIINSLTCHPTLFKKDNSVFLHSFTPLSFPNIYGYLHTVYFSCGVDDMVSLPFLYVGRQYTYVIFHSCFQNYHLRSALQTPVLSSPPGSIVLFNTAY